MWKCNYHRSTNEVKTLKRAIKKRYLLQTQFNLTFPGATKIEPSIDAADDALVQLLKPKFATKQSVRC